MVAQPNGQKEVLKMPTELDVLLKKKEALYDMHENLSLLERQFHNFELRFGEAINNSIQQDRRSIWLYICGRIRGVEESIRSLGGVPSKEDDQ